MPDEFGTNAQFGFQNRQETSSRLRDNINLARKFCRPTLFESP
jgi:hypothetical protein